MRALFKSHNLLGDGLNIYPSLKAWIIENPHAEVFIDCLPDYSSIIYQRMGWQMQIATDTNTANYDFFFNFDVGKAFAIGEKEKCHITQAYAKMLGATLPDDLRSYELRFDVEEEEHEKDLILFSVFSKSCSSREGKPPNKMLPVWKVNMLLHYFRQFGKIGILGSEGDRMHNLLVTEDEYYTGLQLNKVALMLRDCKRLVTIDNGIAHLAATQCTPTILFYPACLSPEWIVPYGNYKLEAIQIDPEAVLMPDLMFKVTSIMEKRESRVIV